MVRLGSNNFTDCDICASSRKPFRTERACSRLKTGMGKSAGNSGKKREAGPSKAVGKKPAAAAAKKTGTAKKKPAPRGSAGTHAAKQLGGKNACFFDAVRKIPAGTVWTFQDLAERAEQQGMGGMIRASADLFGS